MRFFAAIALIAVSVAMFSPSAIPADNDLLLKEFMRRLLYPHAADPHAGITFEFSGKARVEGAILFFRVGDDCDLSGKGEFALDSNNKLIIRAENVLVSCRALLKLAESAIGKQFKDNFALPDLGKMAAKEAIDFIVLLPEEAALYAGLGAIEEVAPGHAVALGAHRELLDYIGRKFPLRSRREAIISLQKRYLQYFEERRLEGKYTAGALAVRIDIDWSSGRFVSAKLRYPWGEPRILVTHLLFERWWVWQTAELWIPYEDRAWARVSVRLSNFRLR
jgi:hypothetical protein